MDNKSTSVFLISVFFTFEGEWATFFLFPCFRKVLFLLFCHFSVLLLEGFERLRKPSGNGLFLSVVSDWGSLVL